MGSILEKLNKKNLINVPKWLPNAVQFEGITGSVAYGVSNDTSDCDVYGWAIPPKEDVFPHLRGEINGFGRHKHQFQQYQEHHIKDESAKKEYDLTVYSIVKYFHLCMECNPNMIDSLFLPRRCILHSTSISEHVRENRHLFLHKGAWHKFKGYSYSQLHKIDVKRNSTNPKRAETIEKYGYDIKFATHVVRLINEIEQILVEHDLDLERNREQLKSVRRGEWTLDQIKDYFNNKEKQLEKVYVESTLPHKPNEKKIKNLLMECLESYYGNIDDAIKKDVDVQGMINDIEEVLKKYKD